MRHLATVLLLLAVSACSTPGSLSYRPAGAVVPGPPRSVSAVAVVDHRDEKPNRVATIRGGYGNPLKVLDTTTPVAEEVRKVFTDALQARAMLAPTGPYHFDVTLQTLYGDQFIGRKTELKMDLAVLDAANRVVYRDSVTDHDYEFTFLDNGIFSKIETLGQSVDTLLGRAVDRLLDNPALQRVLAQPAAPVLAQR